MDTEVIKITIDLGEVCDDVVTQCRLISKQLGTEVDSEIRADIQSPDSDETRSIVCRAATEAIGQIKYAAQRYLRVGRSEDSNTLERLGSVTTVGDKDVVTYEKQEFKLYIPNFNLAVTDALKSSMHKYVCDHIMWRFLQNQASEKAGEYKTLAETEDLGDITVKLNARTTFRRAVFAEKS